MAVAPEHHEPAWLDEDEPAWLDENEPSLAKQEEPHGEADRAPDQDADEPNQAQHVQARGVRIIDLLIGTLVAVPQLAWLGFLGYLVYRILS